MEGGHHLICFRSLWMSCLWYERCPTLHVSHNVDTLQIIQDFGGICKHSGRDSFQPKHCSPLPTCPFSPPHTWIPPQLPHAHPTKVFLTFSPFCPSVQGGLFMWLPCSRLSRSSFSLARQTKRNVSPHRRPPPPSPLTPPHTHIQHPLLLTNVCREPAWRGWELPHTHFPNVHFTYSGLREDGLSLGFLGRHHRTLFTVPTKSELLDKHKCLSCWEKTSCWIYLGLTKLEAFVDALLEGLTGSISMVPGGPATPSAPGRPGRPGGPCSKKNK